MWRVVHKTVMAESQVAETTAVPCSSSSSHAPAPCGEVEGGGHGCSAGMGQMDMEKDQVGMTSDGQRMFNAALAYLLVERQVQHVRLEAGDGRESTGPRKSRASRRQRLSEWAER